MREIKFRAWFKAAPKAEYAMQYWKLGTGLDRSVFFDAAIENGAIMQFTGLKDKNGKEIYEGDIMRYELWHGGVEAMMMEDHAKMQGKTLDWFKNVVILWHEKASCWIYRDTNDILDMDYQGNTWSSSFAPEWEIIGNIYQNPELLQDAKA